MSEKSNKKTQGTAKAPSRPSTTTTTPPHPAKASSNKKSPASTAGSAGAQIALVRQREIGFWPPGATPGSPSATQTLSDPAPAPAPAPASSPDARSNSNENSSPSSAHPTHPPNQKKTKNYKNTKNPKTAQNHPPYPNLEPPPPHDRFGDACDPAFPIPPRLACLPRPLVEAVNDFHFALLNDSPRNQFYWNLLRRHVTSETRVLEIGAGSGLLSMMAAQLGAKWVVAVEGAAAMAALARAHVEANGFASRVKVLHGLSTELEVGTALPTRADLLVSEIFGTLLLGESALDYIVDARAHLLQPQPTIVPRFGTQFAVPIECPALAEVTTVSGWGGLDLSGMRTLQDTVSVVFTKQYGFRLNGVPFRVLAEPLALFTIDFAASTRASVARRRSWEVRATASGHAHAWLFYWRAFDTDADADADADAAAVLSTAPWDTLDNFARDTHWGQALQLIDAGGDPAMPRPLQMREGQVHRFEMHLSEDRVTIYMEHVPSVEELAKEQTG